MRLLSLLMLIPALALCIYVYFKDRVEKEPFALLALLFLVGAAVCLPLHYLEQLIAGGLDKAYSGLYSVSLETGMREYASEAARISHDALYSFVGVACIEELVKWFSILLITNKCKDFDCLFDGIVYHVFYSFGFALAETIRFTVNDGMNLMLMRALTVIPSYLLFGIVSGFIYTLWHCYSAASKKEKQRIEEGVYTEKRIRIVPLLFVLGIIIPIFVHGLCSMTELSNSRDLRFVYFCIVVFLYAACFLIVQTVSKRDAKNEKIAETIVQRAHRKDAV